MRRTRLWWCRQSSAWHRWQPRRRRRHPCPPMWRTQRGPSCLPCPNIPQSNLDPQCFPLGVESTANLLFWIHCAFRADYIVGCVVAFSLNTPFWKPWQEKDTVYVFGATLHSHPSRFMCRIVRNARKWLSLHVSYYRGRYKVSEPNHQIQLVPQIRRMHSGFNIVSWILTWANTCGCW